MRATCCYKTSPKVLIGTGQIMRAQTLSLAVMLPAFISTRKKRGYGLLGKTCSGQFTTTCSLKDEEKRDKNREKKKREDLRR